MILSCFSRYEQNCFLPNSMPRRSDTRGSLYVFAAIVRDARAKTPLSACQLKPVSISTSTARATIEQMVLTT